MVVKIDNNGNIDDCDIVETTNAIAVNTSVSGGSVSLTGQTTEAIVIDTNITPEESQVEPGVICEAIQNKTSITTSTEPTTTTSSPSTTTTSDSNTTTTSGLNTTTTTSEYCAPGCRDSWIGDYFCDEDCNGPECNYDNGDCDICLTEQTDLLRHFRDNLLSQIPEGQEIIKLYYQSSPVIFRAMEADEEFKEEVKEVIDWVLVLIGGGAE